MIHFHYYRQKGRGDNSFFDNTLWSQTHREHKNAAGAVWLTRLNDLYYNMSAWRINTEFILHADKPPSPTAGK